MNFLLNIYHLSLAFLGSVFYGFPSRKIFVVGVTGTKGKSTTVELLNAIFEAAGKKTAVLGSIRRKIGERSERNPSSMTMPGRFFIQRFLHEAVRAGCTHAFLEVTSQGVRQHRHRFINFNAAVFLNITPEHIESHGSFEKYLEAKKDFFRSVRASSKNSATFYINKGDEHSPDFRAVAGSNIVLFSRHDFLRDYLYGKPENAGRWLAQGDFLLEDAAAAAAVAEHEGVSRVFILGTFQKFTGVPGRFEVVQEEPFRVVVDYAHTPASLRAIYTALREQLLNKSQGQHHKLICVLGAAGGGRDRSKRPAMGKIAEMYCDSIILTNEDPYDERPDDILSEIASGISRKRNVLKILDRRSALAEAVRQARPGDVVIATGKGSESAIHFERGRALPWNEKEVVLRLLHEIREEQKENGN